MSRLIHDPNAPKTDALVAWRDQQAVTNEAGRVVTPGGPGYDAIWTYAEWLIASGRGKDDWRTAMAEVNQALHKELVVSVGAGKFRFIHDTTGIHFVADANGKAKALREIVCVNCMKLFKQRIVGQKFCSTTCNAIQSNHRVLRNWRNKK